MVLNKQLFGNVGLSYNLWDFCFGDDIKDKIIESVFTIDNSKNKCWSIWLKQKYIFFNSYVSREILLKSYSSQDEANEVYIQLVLSNIG